jgi:hypothetical protein
MSWINQNKIYIRTSVEISKQNCASSATYYYQQEFAPPGMEIKNFESEATKIKNTFQNYQVFDLFSQQYKNCIIKWQSYNNSTQVRKPLDPCFLSNPPNVTVIKLEPDKPGCLVFLPGNVNTPSGVGIKQGTKCSYTILGFNGDPPYVSPGQRGLGATGGRISSHYNIRTGNLVSFGKLTINSPVNSSTITCVKGKVAKKVTAIKPKCPAGYKKK